MTKLKQNAPKKAVLVLDGPGRIVVTIARSLWAQEIPVYVGRPATCKAPAFNSRAIKGIFRLPADSDVGVEALIAALAKIQQECGFDTIIPASDQALTLVSRHYESLRALARVVAPPPPIANSVLDKTQTLAAATRLGIPTPASHQIRSIDDLDSAEDLRFPLVTKPATKAIPGGVRHFTSIDGLRGAFAEDPAFGERNLLQEFCPGNGVGISTLFWDNEPLTMFQHRRIKEFPCAGGVAVVCESEALDGELAEMAARLLRALQWEGVAQVEFRRDKATGSTVLMEINGRFWGSVPLSYRAGVDFPFYAWQLAHGQIPSIRPGYPAGVRVRWSVGTGRRMKEILAGLKSGRYRFGFAARETWGFIADFGPGTKDAMWSWRDPGPAISELTFVLNRSVNAGMRAAANLILPSSVRGALDSAHRLGLRGSSRYLRNAVMDRTRGVERKSLAGGIRSLTFVCRGNIIRSPMAYELFRKKLADGNGGGIKASSCGTGAINGRSAELRAVSAAAEFGVDLSRHRAKRIDEELLAESDLVIVMDHLDRAVIESRFPDSSRKIMLITEVSLSKPHSIPPPLRDPYRGSLDSVRSCYTDLVPLIDELWRRLRHDTEAKPSRRSGAPADPSPSAGIRHDNLTYERTQS